MYFESVVANAENESRILQQERREEHKIADRLNSLINDQVKILQIKVNSLRTPSVRQFPNPFRGQQLVPRRRPSKFPRQRNQGFSGSNPQRNNLCSRGPFQG